MPAQTSSTPWAVSVKLLSTYVLDPVYSGLVFTPGLSLFDVVEISSLLKNSTF